MRSLMAKLVLAFLITSVAGVLLASIFIRQFVSSQFDDYVVRQQRAEFVTRITSYYESSGSWSGLESWLGQPSNLPPEGQAPAPGPRPQRFGLVDTTGVVVLPFGGHSTGSHVDQATLANGTVVTVSDHQVGYVITPPPPTFRNVAEERYLGQTDLALAIAAGVMVAVALMLGTLLARVITRPVRELTAAAEKIASGDLAQQVPVRSSDELGVLADQFNRMSADLARATELRRQMTADIAHDLRTPLTVIGGYVEALRDQVLSPTPERFATIHDEIQHLQRLVEDLHMLSLADAGELRLDRQIVPPRQLLERVADTYSHAAAQRGIDLQVRVGAEVSSITVDVEHTVRALSNLVSNALRDTPPGGQVALLAQSAPAQVELVVADTGVGISPDHLASVFNRFHRLDESRQEETGGSGLGLAIVKSIVEAHGGKVSVESQPGQGATFTISLPLQVVAPH